MKILHTEREFPDTVFVERRCSGPCSQGRGVCQTPEACEVPADPEVEAVFWRLYGAILIVALCVGVAWLL